MIGTYSIDPDGIVTPCSEEEAKLLSEDWERRHVAHDILVDGTEVSTVFTPFAIEIAGERPQLFETAVITAKPKSTVVARYRTKIEALEGHESIVRRLQQPRT